MMPLRRISVAVALLCGLALFAPLGPGVQAVPLSRPEAGFYADIGHPDLQTFDALNASALAKPYIDGAAIVVQWGEIEPRPGVYDWTILDRWAVPTVRLHKKLSLGVIAGLFAPAWLYGPGYDVPKNVFRFNRSGSDAHPWCDDAFTQPSFWSGTYVREYGTMMKALAEHLRVMQAPDVPRGSAYAALYLVKLSGINNTTEELRIDASAPDDGPCRQSDAAAIWAKAGLASRRHSRRSNAKRPPPFPTRCRRLRSSIAAPFPRWTTTAARPPRPFPTRSRRRSSRHSSRSARRTCSSNGTRSINARRSRS